MYSWKSAQTLWGQMFMTWSLTTNVMSLLSVGEGGACGDFLAQTVRHISSLKHETRPRRLWQELKQRSDPEVTKGSVIGEL